METISFTFMSTFKNVRVFLNQKLKAVRQRKEEKCREKERKEEKEEVPYYFTKKYTGEIERSRHSGGSVG